MGGNIRLSEQHGVNPSVGKCFFCNEDKEVVLLGRLPGDQEAPRSAVYNKEPCEKCKGYMELGVVLISVDEKLSEEDRRNSASVKYCSPR